MSSCLLGPFLCIVSFRCYMFCLLVVLVELSVLAKWLARKTPLRKPNCGEGIVSRKPRPKSAHDFLGLLYCFIVYLLSPASTWYIILVLRHDIAYLCWKCRSAPNKQTFYCCTSADVDVFVLSCHTIICSLILLTLMPAIRVLCLVLGLLCFVECIFSHNGLFVWSFRARIGYLLFICYTNFNTAPKKSPVVCNILVSVVLCGLRGCKTRHAPFPGWMS